VNRALTSSGEVTETYAVGLLRGMLEIPSPSYQERALADFLAGAMADLGLRTHIDAVGNVVGVVERGAGPTLMLLGHLDTVPGQLPVRCEDGRLHGRGASDMKAGDAVMLSLIETLDADALRFDLAAAFYDAEEGPSEGNGLARVLREMPWLSQARLAIVLEPTDLRIEMGCVGMMNAEVRVAGKPAHSARPWLGVNAVERAAPWLAEITRFPSTPQRVGGVEFHETLQVTTLRAGRTRNVVPDELVANLNYRFPPGRTLEEAGRRLRALVPAEFEFRVVDQAPAGDVCSDLPEVREFVERFRPKVAGKQGWTDVARFTAAGVPAFNYGPGVPEQAHQADEFCPLVNLMPCYQRLARFLSKEGA